ncbi:hypothetical protein CRENBAI_009697 [Crenichthys baileyi]|uniref:Uncharacterized protein n=1 Tax=Crenichthys baileyi TaxID=28760 RepID=A0AAV9RV45_9TELE
MCSREVPSRDTVSTKSGAVFPGLKGRPQEPHPVVTCSVVSGQNGPPSHCSGDTEKVRKCHHTAVNSKADSVMVDKCPCQSDSSTNAERLVERLGALFLLVGALRKRDSRKQKEDFGWVNTAKYF